MGLLDKIKLALDKRKVSSLKKKITHFDNEATKQGKRVESLTIILNPHPLSRRSVFLFVLSDGTTNKQDYNKNRPPRPKKTNKNINNKRHHRVTPVVEKCPTPPPLLKKAVVQTLVGRSYDYDEKFAWVEEYEPGVEVFLVVRKDGIKDILKIRCSNEGSVPKRTIWWMENEAKVCERFKVSAARPPKEPLISSWTRYRYP